MIPPRFFHIYHFIVAISHVLAGFIYMGFGIYGLVESRGSDLAITLFMCAFGMFLIGAIHCALVTPRGMVRRSPKLIWILTMSMLILMISEIVIFALAINNWNSFLKRCMLLEYPHSIITRFFDKNDVVVKVLLFLGGPFQALWFFSAYILSVGHF